MMRLLGLSFAAAALLTASFIAAQEGEGRPRARTITGQVGKVESQSLTLVFRGDGGERSEKFAVDAQTKILVQTDEDNIVKGGEGGERKVPKTKDGKLSDVKEGQRVTVGYVEAGKAQSILVLRAAKERKREGEN